MRIGIDCRTILNPTLGEKAGVGHYTYYLVKHLLKLDHKNTYVLFFDHRHPALHEFERKNTEIVHFPYSKYKRYLPFAYSHVFVSQVLNQAKLDVFHGPANILPLQYRRPAVITVHDLAIYKHPEWFPPKQDFAVKVLVPKSVARAQQIIAVSQSTADDLRQKFQVNPARIQVIYEGHEPVRPISKLKLHQVLKQYRLAERYFLYIGTLEPRKNIAGLITAFDQLVSQHPRRYQDVQLVLAGAKGYRFEDNYKAIHKVQAGQVRYVGYVSAADKAALLQGALAFVFPSLYEGFGLPVLEAMSAGAPVITSTVSSLPEVAGKAALLVQPTSTVALAKALDRMLDSVTRQRYRKLGQEQVTQFTWERCAQETLHVYEQTAQNHPENHSRRAKKLFD